jgi:hypothetical protein
MVEVTAIKGGKREPCIYCGGEPHPTQLACPRIAMIHVDSETATITGISFWEDFFDEQPTPDDSA